MTSDQPKVLMLGQRALILRMTQHPTIVQQQDAVRVARPVHQERFGHHVGPVPRATPNPECPMTHEPRFNSQVL